MIPFRISRRIFKIKEHYIQFKLLDYTVNRYPSAAKVPESISEKEMTCILLRDLSSPRLYNPSLDNEVNKSFFPPLSIFMVTVTFVHRLIIK